MDAVELFGGVGGFALGLPTTVNIIKSYELDRAACDVYEKLIGTHVEQCDLSKYDLRRLPDADLIFGGPPCPDFSRAGPNTGEFGVRNLWPVAIEAVRLKCPRVFVFENVFNMTQGKHRAYFEGIISTFRDLGYSVKWKLLDAADYGVAQNRLRVFIAGRLDDQEICWPEPTHWNNPSGLFYQRWNAWYDTLSDWFVSAEQMPGLPKWLVQHYAKLGKTIPDVAFFNGGRQGGKRVKQHRGIGEPAFTITANYGNRKVARVKIGETIYRLDAKACARLQSLPFVDGLTITQVGNSVAPQLAKALFTSLLAN